MKFGFAVGESDREVIVIYEYDCAGTETFVGDGVTGLKAIPRLSGKVLTMSGMATCGFRRIKSKTLCKRTETILLIDFLLSCANIEVNDDRQ